jgi:multidrug transporter EmrE-like cation transporter
MYWKTTLGWFTLILSVCCTVLVYSFPFFDMPVKKMTVGMAAAMITGKGLFAASAMLLGKPVLEQLKRRFRFWKK